MPRPKGKTERKNKPPTFNPKDARPKPLFGLLFLCLFVLILVALWDYQPAQSRHITTAAAEINAGGAQDPSAGDSLIDDRRGPNLVGLLGAEIGFYAYYLIGWGAWLVPLYLLWVSYMYFFANAHKLRLSKLVAVVISVANAAALADWVEATGKSGAIDNNLYTAGLGGIVGEFIFSDLLRSFLGPFGGPLVLVVVFLGSTVFTLHDNLAGAGLAEKVVRWRTALEAWLKARKAQREARRAQRRAAARAKELAKAKSAAQASRDSAPPTRRRSPVQRAPATGRGDDSETAFSSEAGAEPLDRGAPGRSSAGKFRSKAARSRAQGDGQLKIVEKETVEKALSQLPKKKGDYLMPPLSLLDEIQPIDQNRETEDHQGMADTLLQTLDEFGVTVTMGEVHIGPVITRYDVHPAAGVRVEKITNLDKNIALNLKAKSVRILAPVPGKGCVGIEVPNANPAPVSIREILESTNWVDGNAEIPIALGKEVSGKPLVADLTKMPHLLIAGATGSGKTVCINTVIASLVFHSSPDDLRFVMVDPKIVEMQIYNDLPHMLIPVVTDPKKVPGALKYLIAEMENRYRIFAKVGVRHITAFNAKRAKEASASKELEADLSPEERAAISTIEVPRDEEIEIPEKLPYVVCIIDELADLMMVAPADIETCISRLAQLARATGIHLIIATQRPSVNVITGVIKANLPSRIAFKVASRVDSRTILDSMGADHLIGRGDMLYVPPGSSDLVRCQGAFVSDDEINAIVDYMKRTGPPEFDEQFKLTVELGEAPEIEEGEDELLPNAIEVLRTTKRASTSMLQRRLRIGYNRAARIMDLLEDRGIVGPENGVQPREILTDLDRF